MLIYTEAETNICQANKHTLVQPREKQQKGLENRAENAAKSECYKGTSWHKVTQVPAIKPYKLEKLKIKKWNLFGLF